MKWTSILPFVAISSAFVVPPEQVLRQIEIEDNHRDTQWYEQVVEEKDRAVEKANDLYNRVIEAAKDTFHDASNYGRNALDQALEQASETANIIGDEFTDKTSAAKSWFDESIDSFVDAFDTERPPHHRHGKHGHRHEKPNMTVYELISKSKYTTKLAEFINEYDDLVEALNSTKANYTIFAPTDKAFAKIPEGAPKPSKKQLKDLLSYHVIPEFYPAGRVLASRTAPTLLKLDSLGTKPQPQRMAFRIGFKGLTVNFYSKVVAINIFGTNGVIHGVDTPLFPPFGAIRMIDLFPGEFSTLELALIKTDLLDKLNTTDHAGGTLFAPSNWAFRKLGPRVNEFLFSRFGLKYLKALLEYHVVPDNTLYSDAFYKAESFDSDAETESVPKGRYHVDLPTLLKDKSVAVDIGRYGRFISITVNAYAKVAISDGIAEDGVVHVMNDVIVPPKKLRSFDGEEELQYWDGEEEMTVDDLVERLEPFVAKTDL